MQRKIHRRSRGRCGNLALYWAAGVVASQIQQFAWSGAFSITKDRDTSVDASGWVAASSAPYGRALNALAFQRETITTYNGYQYTAYWKYVSGTGRLAVARRPVGSSTWETMTLDTTLVNGPDDAHNVVSFGIDEVDGTIHLAYDMHGHTLRYRVSNQNVVTNPGSITWNTSLFSSAETSQLISGQTINGVTYPTFIRRPSGDLQLAFRLGSSGSGSWWMYDYSGATHAWSKGHQIDDGFVGSYTGTSSSNSTSRNSYYNGFHYGSDGKLHASFVWRESATGIANHDINYVYSEDGGNTWKNNAGQVVSDQNGGTPEPSTFSLLSPGIIVRRVEETQTLMNQQSQAVDGDGRIHMLMWQRDPAKTIAPASPWDPEESSYYHYWRDNLGNWHLNKIPSYVGQRPQIYFDSNGNAYAIYQVLQGGGSLTSGIYISNGDLVIAAASKASNWTDWKIIHQETTGPFVTEGQADARMLLQNGVLSVFMQESPSGSSRQGREIRVMDYTITLTPPTVHTFSASSGDWDVSGNWSGGLPSGNADAFISGNRTARVDQMVSTITSGVIVGSAGGNGTLNIVTGGQLNVDGSVIIGRDGGGVGRYNQSGGTVNARRFVVGDYYSETSGGGASTATISGGTLNITYGSGSLASGELQIAVSANGSSNGSAFVQSGGVVNVGGDIIIADNGSTGSLILSGGTLNVAGEIRSGFNKTNVGTLRMDGGTLSFSGHQSANMIAVDQFIYNGGTLLGVSTTSTRYLAGISAGTVQIGPNQAATFTLPANTRMAVNNMLDVYSGATLTLGSSAAVRVGSVGSLLTGDFAANTVNITNGGTLAGDGRVNAPVNNTGGTVAPGHSTGILTVGGNFTQAAGGTTEIELGGLLAGQYDQLNITGSATLAGNLVVKTFGGYMPLPGQSYDVMTFASRSGSLTILNQTGYLGLVLTPTYSATKLTLLTSALFGGDADLDGDVDNADFGAFFSHFGTASGALWTEGDFDSDGDVDNADFGIFFANFGSSAAPMPADLVRLDSPSVPEPAAGATLLICLAGAVSRRRMK